LYKNPKILILDEATNALDNITEIKVIDEIIKNKSDMTIITITHRLNTLKKCDQIILIDKGEIAAKGDYKFLKENNYFFSDIT
jgi:ABC-type multidrug transport system fused ATPase/permease subunit